MTADDIAALMIPATWLAMMAIEALSSAGRSWPTMRLWRTRAMAFFFVYMTLNALLPGFLPASFSEHALVRIASLPVVVQVAISYCALSLAGALVHRAYHRYDLLWRWVHQLHHSPQRVDAAGAIVLTPFEMVVYIALFQLIVVFGLGLSPLAAAIVGYIGAFYSLFQHFNIRTPQWLGIFIQRPESHAVHHRRDLHGFNYSDLPVWDMLMGTYRNPKVFNGDVGFEVARPGVMRMLLGHDVNAERNGKRNRGTKSPNVNPA